MAEHVTGAVRGSGVKRPTISLDASETPAKVKKDGGAMTKKHLASNVGFVAVAATLAVIAIVSIAVIAIPSETAENSAEGESSKGNFLSQFFGAPRRATGEKGAREEKGEQGKAGKEGGRGPRRGRGIPGMNVQSEKPLKGDPGPAGPKGEAGPVGPAGPKGDIGPQGPAGPVGPQGAKGRQGKKGRQGERGEQGPPGPPTTAAKTPLPLFGRHIRARIAWDADDVLNTAGVVGLYDSEAQACHITITKGGWDTAAGTDDLNASGLSINISSERDDEKNNQLVTFTLTNNTNDSFLVAAVYHENCNTTPGAVTVSDPSPGVERVKDYRYCVAQTDDGRMLQFAKPKEECVFGIKYDLGNSDGISSSVLFLADTAQSANVMRPHSQPVTRVQMLIQNASPGRIRTVRENEFDFEAIGNPIVHLKLPSSQEINELYGFKQNTELLQTALEFLRGPRSLRSTPSIDREDFCRFLLYFLLHSTLLFLTKTGWTKAGLSYSPGFGEFIRRGVIDTVVPSYTNMIPNNIASTFVTESGLFEISSTSTILSKKCETAVPDLMKRLLSIGDTQADLFAPAKSIVSVL